MITPSQRIEMLVNQAAYTVYFSRSPLKRELAHSYLAMLARTTEENCSLANKYIEKYDKEHSKLSEAYRSVLSKGMEEAYHSTSKL